MRDHLLIAEFVPLCALDDTIQDEHIAIVLTAHERKTDGKKTETLVGIQSDQEFATNIRSKVTNLTAHYWLWI